MDIFRRKYQVVTIHNDGSRHYGRKFWRLKSAEWHAMRLQSVFYDFSGNRLWFYSVVEEVPSRG